ncbi:hypothetical protein E2C01_101400 [Portunus trituberculatus]|uniref:Uncharacterized protein n=1 Tax=Portunus trituberculatus TaxID=210409 RepID=A0A5B7KLW3_PORTR|nr:hypothetical protein [Portunus trituberculatus]
MKIVFCGVVDLLKEEKSHTPGGSSEKTDGRLKTIENDNEIMKANTEVLKKNYDNLKNKVCTNEKKMEDNGDQVRKISEKLKHWKMTRIS